jgi:hypothetical protein
MKSGHVQYRMSKNAAGRATGLGFRRTDGFGSQQPAPLCDFQHSMFDLPHFSRVDRAVFGAAAPPFDTVCENGTIAGGEKKVGDG